MAIERGEVDKEIVVSNEAASVGKPQFIRT